MTTKFGKKYFKRMEMKKMRREKMVMKEFTNFWAIEKVQKGKYKNFH
jgi:hypothetical protein